MGIKDGFIKIFSGPSVVFFCNISGPLNRGWNFEVLLGNKRRFTWGWAEVLFMDHSVQIQYWTRLAWPELFSLQLLCVFLVIANEWEGAFFWPIAFSHLCWDTQTRMRLHGWARPKVSLRLNTVTVNEKSSSYLRQSLKTISILRYCLFTQVLQRKLSICRFCWGGGGGEGVARL